METLNKEIDIEKNLSTDKELDKLLLKITDISSQDKDILNSINKISDKSLDSKIVNSFLLNQEKFANKDIFSYIEHIVDTHPELWFFISGNLGLGNLSGKKYADLSSNEKIKLLVLYDTLNDKISNILSLYKDGKTNKINVSKFEKSYNAHMKSMFDKLSVDFKLSQLSNFGNIEKTLMEDYSLTTIEAKKFIIYLKNIKDQLQNDVKESKLPLGYLFALLTGVLIGAMGVNWYYSFKYPNAETLVKTGRVEIGDPRLIAKLLPVEADFSTVGSIKKSQFSVNDSDYWLMQQAKKVGNVAQTKEIIMELNGKFAVQFDLDNSIFEYDYDTKKIYAYLKAPNILITEANPKIIKRNSEIFEIKSFDNVEMELFEDLKKDVISQSTNKNLILIKAKENAEQILHALYSHALSVSGLELNGVEVVIDGFVSQDIEKHGN